MGTGVAHRGGAVACHLISVYPGPSSDCQNMLDAGALSLLPAL